jgi:hypothetical protein
VCDALTDADGYDGAENIPAAALASINPGDLPQGLPQALPGATPIRPGGMLARGVELRRGPRFDLLQDGKGASDLRWLNTLRSTKRAGVTN